MPWGLKRFQQSKQLHFLTFSCYGRRANFTNNHSRSYFETALERIRQSYGMCVYGYVVMPEHVHFLVSEPEREALARALQSLKQSLARTLALRVRSGRRDITTSMCGASASSWRSCGIFIAIR